MNHFNDDLVKSSGSATRGDRVSPYIILLIGLLSALVLGVGCGGQNHPGADSLISDANGYQCAECQSKFFTMDDVFAEVCPKCKSLNLKSVVAFVCQAPATATEAPPSNPSAPNPCGTITLAPRDAGAVPCSNASCSRVLTEFKMPSSEELKSWGASGPETDSVMR